MTQSLSRVRWATPLGGAGADAAYSLHRDDTTGELWVAGGTSSASLSGTAGGYRNALGGDVDGFVAHLSAAGALLQATYLGTGSYDQAYFVRRGGPQDQLYVLGQTLGAWPGLGPGRFGTANGHQFVQQLAPDLRTAGFATVFGGGRAGVDISPTAFGVDCFGRIFLAGWGGGLNLTSTLGLPTTPNAFNRHQRRAGLLPAATVG